MESFLDISQMLGKRDKSAEHPLFVADISEASHTILLSSSDLGVCRNGGRRGTKFAPTAIINSFKKTSSIYDKQFYLSEVADELLESQDFSQAQLTETENIKNIIQHSPASHTLHIGGGHDHVYPFLMSIAAKYPNIKISIINIDAHLDTRNDHLAHSGTPFRQFLTEHPQSTLYQFGIHNYTNVSSNSDDLSQQMQIITVEAINSMTSEQFIKKLDQILVPTQDTIYVLSLDADALSASIMEAVSAVNHQGLSLTTVKIIFNKIKALQPTQQYLGIYEYNPIYDNLSQKGARALTDLIVSWI